MNRDPEPVQATERSHGDARPPTSRGATIAAALAQRARAGVLAYTLLGLTVAGVTARRADEPWYVAAFAVGLALIGAVRLVLLRGASYGAAPAAWTRAFRAGALGAAAYWGIAGGLVTARGLGPDALIMLVATAGLAAGAITSLSPDLGLCRAYVLVLLAPIVAAMVLRDGAEGLAVASVATLFIAFLLVQAKNLHRDYCAALNNVDLLAARAEALEAARARAADAEVAARTASRAKSDFLANMSHEVRTPMTAIIGFAELLLAPDLSGSERIAHAETIRRNGAHLLEILNEILDLSKIEAGKMTVTAEACSPRDALADVDSLMRARATERGLAFDVVLDTAIPRSIASDGTRLRQILINLVGNAIKFTRAGSVMVRARLEDRRGSRRLLVDVVDTGVGMSAGDVASLFQPFTQLESSSTRRHEGTGLGLHLSRKFARMMGGDIHVASEPGKGSTFTLDLPVPEDARNLVDSMRIERPSSAAEEPPAATLTGLRVLLAEDGQDNQRLVCAILRRAGAHVDVVGDGLAAVEAASLASHEGCPYDVVLMDMQMPIVDGYGATARLRETGYRGAIVALTAHAMAENRERSLVAGCDAHLTKPIQAAQMVACLSRYAPRGGPPDAPAAEAGPLESSLLDDPDVAELVVYFFDALEQQVPSLRAAVEARDDARAAQIAHVIAGTGGSFGFDAITAAARRLERACASPEGGVAGAAEDLVRLCKRALESGGRAIPTERR